MNKRSKDSFLFLIRYHFRPLSVRCLHWTVLFRVCLYFSRFVHFLKNHMSFVDEVSGLLKIAAFHFTFHLEKRKACRFLEFICYFSFLFEKLYFSRIFWVYFKWMQLFLLPILHEIRDFLFLKRSSFLLLFFEKLYF